MGNKNLKIRVGMAFNAEVIFERAVTIGAWSGLVIYGRHVNGYFVCIPGEYAAEMAEPSPLRRPVMLVLSPLLMDGFSIRPMAASSSWPVCCS